MTDERLIENRIWKLLAESIKGEKDETTIPVPVEDIRRLIDAREKAHTPTDDQRSRVIAELRWLADARQRYETETFPSIAREAQTARHLADILERATPVAEGGQGFGWIPSWLWDEWDQMAGTPPEVPEPSAEGPAFIALMPPSPETSKRWYSMYCRVCGIEEMMADTADDPRLLARRDEHNRERHAEPQGEPSDAEVEAGAREAFFTDDAGGHIRGGHTWGTIPEVGRENYRTMVRAVLHAARAAGGAR